MVTTTAGPAVIRRDDDSGKGGNGSDGHDINNNQKLPVIPQHFSPDLRRKSKRHEIRRVVSFSSRHPLLREMRLFARSLSRGSNDRLDALDNIGTVCAGVSR